jgi:hypothetical protein
MGNPQPRTLETGLRFNDYSNYPKVSILWRNEHEWVPWYIFIIYLEDIV